MLRSTRPPKCKVCRQRTDGLPLHDECVGEWVRIVREKKDRAMDKKLAEARRNERKRDRERKKALETIPELIKAAQREFNAYIRERDKDKPCICCGRPLGEGDVGGAYDAGHYRSRGSAPHLRFDERNCHAQRKACNRWGAGRAVDYRVGLIHRIGAEAVSALEADNRVHKWTHEELRDIAAKYRQKRKELAKGD